MRIIFVVAKLSDFSLLSGHLSRIFSILPRTPHRSASFAFGNVCACAASKVEIGEYIGVHPGQIGTRIYIGCTELNTYVATDPRKLRDRMYC
jgi:hypothetical protein